MTKKQFRLDCRRGLGSCHVALNKCENIEKYRNDVLWAVRNAMAYDAQCEGTRANYIFEMIERYEDQSEFYQLIYSEAIKSINKRGWKFDHYSELLAHMASNGSEQAENAVYELYDLILDLLKNNKPLKNGIWAAADNLSSLCVTIITIVIHEKEDQEAFFLRVIKDYGELIIKRPSVKCRFTDDWFEDTASELLGVERVKELIGKGIVEPRISAYSDNRENMTAMREIARIEQTSETADSIYEKLRSGMRAGIELPVMLLTTVERENGSAEIERLVDIYSFEEEEELREALLQLFSRETITKAFGEKAIDRLISDAQSDNETLRNQALIVMSNIRSGKVRDFALKKLEASPVDEDAFHILVTNYAPGDGMTLIRYTKNVSTDEQKGNWHSAFIDIIELICTDKQADLELSAELLPYIYRNGFCSCCRMETVKMMLERNLLTAEMIDECRYDSNSEIRRLIVNGDN